MIGALLEPRALRAIVEAPCGRRVVRLAQLGCTDGCSASHVGVLLFPSTRLVSGCRAALERAPGTTSEADGAPQADTREVPSLLAAPPLRRSIGDANGEQRVRYCEVFASLPIHGVGSSASTQLLKSVNAEPRMPMHG